MSIFRNCDSDKCTSIAQILCNCSNFLGCQIHFGEHALSRPGQSHTIENILVPLLPDEQAAIKSSLDSSYERLNVKIKDIIHQKDEKLAQLYLEIKQTEEKYSREVEKLLKAISDLQRTYEEVLKYQSIPSISDTPIAASIAQLKKTLNFSLYNINALLWNEPLSIAPDESSISYTELSGHNGWVNTLAFSGDGQLLVSGGHDKRIMLWNTQGRIWEIAAHTDRIRSVVFSPCCKFIASAGYDKSIRIWKTETGEPVCSYQGHTDCIRSLSYSPSGLFIASGSADSYIRVWGLKEKKSVKKWIAHKEGVWSVSFSPCGYFIVSGGSDNAVRVWKIDTCENVSTPITHDKWTITAVFSPCGNFIASASPDMTVKIWNSGNVKTCTGHTHEVYTVDFSPCGRFVASGSNDMTVKIWNVETGNCMTTLKGHLGTARAVVYSPCGKFLASASYDKTIRIWQLY